MQALQHRHNEYAVTLSLLDDQDRVIAKSDHWFYSWYRSAGRKVVGNLVWPDWGKWDLQTTPSMGPLLLDEGARFHEVVEMSETFTLDTEQLARVKKYAASIEHVVR